MTSNSNMSALFPVISYGVYPYQSDVQTVVGHSYLPPYVVWGGECTMCSSTTLQCALKSLIQTFIKKTENIDHAYHSFTIRFIVSLPPPTRVVTLPHPLYQHVPRVVCWRA